MNRIQYELRRIHWKEPRQTVGAILIYLTYLPYFLRYLANQLCNYLIQILLGAYVIEQFPSGHQFEHENDLSRSLVDLV